MPAQIRLALVTDLRRLAIKTFIALLLLSLPMLVRAETVEYIHSDPLGNVVAISNQSGQVIERFNYDPYGGLVGKANYDRPGYTGHVMDTLTILTYMQQRYYDPNIGRFLSVDPVTAYEKPMTNFNRYVYGLNNPYKFTDPDGRYWCSGGKAQCAAVESYVAGIRKSLGYLRAGTAEYDRVSNVVERLGKPWTMNGTTVNPTVLPKNELANAGRGGIINIDLAQTSAYAKRIAAANPNVAPGDARTAAGAGVIAHETKHHIVAGKDGQLPTSRSEEFKSEKEAFTTESAVAKGLGVNVGLSTSKDIESAANQATDAWCKKGGGC